MRRFAVLALSLSAYMLPSYATAIFTSGNNPQPGEENVLFSADQTGATIDGVTNLSSTGVVFTSTLDTLMATAKGQANLTASDGLINNVSIALAGGTTFGDIILNPSAATGTSSGTTTVTVVTNDGTFAHDYGALGNGSNFLTITTSGGETISSVSIDSTGGFDTLRQVRISGITGVTPGPPPGTVPEPSTFAMLGGAVLALIPIARRRKA